MRLLLTLLLLFSVSPLASADEFRRDIHVWVRAFIPHAHPTLPSMIFKTDLAGYVLVAPSVPKPFDAVYGDLVGTCFMTDNRTFDSDINASARIAADFIVQIRGREMIVAKAGKEWGRTGITRNVDCRDGRDLRLPRQESTKGITASNVKVSNFLRTADISATGRDPFYDTIPVPAIDFTVMIGYDIRLRRLVLGGTVGAFPAYEGYYSIDGGQTKTFFTMQPADKATPFSLVDLGGLINTRGIDPVTIPLMKFD